MNYFKQIALVFGGAWNGRKYSIRSASALRAFIRVAPDVIRRLDQEHADRGDFRAIGRVIAPWGRRIGDLRFETEGAWKRGGTTVESLDQRVEAGAAVPGGRGGLNEHTSHHRRRRLHRIESRSPHARPHLRSPRHRRQADICRQPAQHRACAERSARALSSRPTSPIARRWRRCSPSTTRAVLNLAAETHVDRSIDGPAPFIETNIVGTFVLLETAVALTHGLGRAARGGFPISPRLDRRGVRHARRRWAVQRRDAVRAEFALRGEQGGGGSSGAGVLPHATACRS